MIALLEFCGSFFRQRQVEAFLVGGALRDELLGRDSHDLDFAVARDALPLARALADALRGAYFPMDVERATARVLAPGGASIDVALLRGGSIVTDLAARDFSINAMARRVDAPGAVLDPHHGQRDLAQRTVRVVSPDAFDSDPARLMRAVRLAAMLAFDLDTQTRALISAKAHLLPLVAGERVRDELVRILELPRRGDALQRLHDFGLLPAVAPGAHWSAETIACLDRREHYASDLATGDRGDAARAQLAGELAGYLTGGRARRVMFAFAALYRDARAFAHDAERLHFSRHEVEYGEALVRHRARLGEAAPDELGAFRFFRQTGVAGVSLLIAALADGEHADVAWLYAQLYRDEFARVIHPTLLVPGGEVAVLVGGHGPVIGRAITALLEAQVSGTVTTREQALAFLAALSASDESNPA